MYDPRLDDLRGRDDGRARVYDDAWFAVAARRTRRSGVERTRASWALFEISVGLWPRYRGVGSIEEIPRRWTGCARLGRVR
jgi:hypothetical protein